jgi:hypothetical protein
MTELYGAIVALAAAFGDAWYGGRLQRSNDQDNLTLQLRIDAAAKLVGTAGDFQFAYGSAWAPDKMNLPLTERHRPIFAVVVALRADAAAVWIVGPDELGEIASDIVRLAAGRRP